MPFIVSRQSYYYDEGAYAVDIASALDYAGPGMLADPPYEEYDDPREAAAAAIQSRLSWSQAYNLPLDSIALTTINNAIVYANIADGMTPDELTAWAAARYEAMPKCDQCGQPLDGSNTWTLINEPDTGSFCSDNCADNALRDYYADNESELSDE